MAMTRTADDLTIHNGIHRSFEWFWEDDDSMPALDFFESLPAIQQDDFLASVKHWGNVPKGESPLSSRVNSEHNNPLIMAIKAGNHRFTAFREESGPTWIVYATYLKQSQRRDKQGDRAIKRTIDARTWYFSKVKAAQYYERT